MPLDSDLEDALSSLVGENEDSSGVSSPASVSGAVREQKRRLHREVVARSRARQRERVVALAKQETQLRRQLTALLLRSRDAQQLASGVYAELVERQQRLLRENEALQVLVHKHYLFSRLVQFERASVVTEKEANVEDKRASHETTEKPGVWLRFSDSEPPLLYEPESPAKCAYLVSVCFHLALYLQNVFAIGTHLRVDVAHVLGWHARRAIHWSEELQKKMLYFSFSRRVPSSLATLEQIQRSSWKVLSSPKMQARLYSIPVRTEIAQEIDENAQIVFQSKAYHVPVRFFSLNAQALEPGLVRQSMMVLDKEPPNLDGSPAVWLREGIICLTFCEDGLRGTVDVEFAGCMRCVDDRHAQFMLIDVGCVLMRWENLVLPPRLLL